MSDLTALFHEEIQRLPRRPEREFLQHALRHGDRGTTVSKAVTGIGITRQYLAERFRDLGMHSPQWYISGARLLAAAHALHSADVRVSKVAETLRFGASADLHKMFRNYTKYSIDTLRTNDIRAFTIAYFRAGLVPHCRPYISTIPVSTLPEVTAVA
jgi:AraC-like DNA-binding protein